MNRLNPQLSPLDKGAVRAMFLSLVDETSSPVGSAALAIFQSDRAPEVKVKMAEAAAKLAKDPMAMQLFCDRVYQLLNDDIRLQQDRSYSHGRR